ncbi:MAG TPA: sorbosone dehydrogenase family protein, partial [Thermoanaerobaculia bacterium]
MRPLLAFALLVLLTACESAKLPVEAAMGPNPRIVEPNHTLIPTVRIAPAKGWTNGAMPRAASGLAVNAFATGLEHPRFLYVLPDGDVLVAESSAPPKKEKPKGIRAWFMARLMKKAGAAVPSANRISLLRDADGDGVAETHTAFLRDLFSPYGIALVGNDLYVANADA